MFNIFPIKGGIGDIDGFYCNGISAQLKENNQLDIGFIFSDIICETEVLFTKNKFQAAPLKHFANYNTNFKTNFVLINSKNANAMTGQNGIDDINEILNNIKEDNDEIINPIMSSTGVIGVRLEKEKIIKGCKKFNLNDKNSHNLAKAIMTTDKYSKSCLYEVNLNSSKTFKIGAVAKGAGMINPNFATMLCFVCTDAKVPKEDMKELLLKHNETTFDAISVDGDTSTNDTVLLLCNGKSNTYDKEAFSEALRMVMEDMAMLMVSDGEGATKAVAFEVTGAKDNKEAKIAAKALSNSLLVKTALFGEDPNWGRIASTIGACEINCHESLLTISFDNIIVYDKGIKPNIEIELKASKILKKDAFKITCDLGIKNGKYLAYGCDLGHEYIKINADYRS